ncbi:MAG: hypothetical protein NT062_23445 [Proteobacteria bacterium]|nr:hypothetical protein [Pseudomonadota bacterium]
MKIRYLLVPVIVSQLGAGECGGPILDDSGFDLWCGDTLCAWGLERGQIARVPTWHDGDAGVGFIGTDVAIDQLSSISSFGETCVEISMIADIATDAEVDVNIDLGDDGVVERMEHIPTASWQPLAYTFLISNPTGGVRFEVSKRGNGAAVLAQLKGVSNPGACTGLTPITQLPAAAPACPRGTLGPGGTCP